MNDARIWGVSVVGALWAVSFILAAAYPVLAEDPLLDDIAAIKAYWVSRHPTPPPDVALRRANFGIEEVKEWPFLREIRWHRLYAFQEFEMDDSGYAVVAVDDSGFVQLIDSEKSFNLLLSDEGIRIKDKRQARAIAESWLRLRYYRGFKDLGWEHGLNVIGSLDDIECERSEACEKALVALESTGRIQIQGPQTTRIGEKYHYCAYSWSPYSRVLSLLEIVLTADGIVKINKTEVGRVD